MTKQHVANRSDYECGQLACVMLSGGLALMITLTLALPGLAWGYTRTINQASKMDAFTIIIDPARQAEQSLPGPIWSDYAASQSHNTCPASQTGDVAPSDTAGFRLIVFTPLLDQAALSLAPDKSHICQNKNDSGKKLNWRNWQD